MLLNISDPVMFRNMDNSLIGLVLAGDDAKQGGLAVAVSTNESDPFPGINLKPCLVKQALAAKAFG